MTETLKLTVDRRDGVAVIKARLRTRRTDSRIFRRGIFSPQFPVRPHLADYRGFIPRVRTNGSARIILVRPTKREANNSDSLTISCRNSRSKAFSRRPLTWIRSLRDVQNAGLLGVLKRNLSIAARRLAHCCRLPRGVTRFGVSWGPSGRETHHR